MRRKPAAHRPRTLNDSKEVNLMPSFDFTALLTFLMSLFEALKKLAEKLGFNFGEDETTTAPTTAAPEGE